MKKIIAVLLAALMLFSLAACADKKTSDGNAATEGTTENATGENTAVDYDAISDTMTSADGKYQIAFVTDVGQLKDKSFNQGTWEGVKKYATDNEKSYKYYQPANGDQATDDDRYDAMKAAVDAGAEIVICAGFLQGTALQKAAEEFTDVKFVFIDGWTLADAEGNALKNVAAVDFQEEQSGYLAGYAAVKEGYTKLGFSGGGGGTNPACCRFGYGYVQGAEAAAKELGIEVEMNYSWEYGASFAASPELQTMLGGWYANGTEVIFSCGGSMCQSAFAAASANDAKVIGVDVDQSPESATVITSAMKQLSVSVYDGVKAFYDGSFPGGSTTVFTAANNGVGLPMETSKFDAFAQADYDALYAKLSAGEIEIQNGTDDSTTADLTLAKTTVNFVE